MENPNAKMNLMKMLAVSDSFFLTIKFVDIDSIADNDMDFVGSITG